MTTEPAPQQPYFPPEPQAKKPLYRRWWAIVLGVFVALMVIGSMTGGGDTGSPEEASASQTESGSSSNSEETSDSADIAPADDTSSTSQDTSDSVESAPAEETSGVAKEVPAEEPELTSGQDNAVRSAEDYLSMSGFSRKGLIEQLTFEGYSKKDAAFAADYLNVNWNKEAAQSAEDYVSMSGFSRSGLIEQLEFEGFTPKQAQHGANKAF